MSERVRISLSVAVVVVLAAGVLAGVARFSDGGSASAVTSTSTTSTPTSTTTEPPRPAIAWPAPAPDGTARVVTTSNGVVMAVLSDAGDGRFVARSPCGKEVTVSGRPLRGAAVVLDPGHGGGEPGAVGPAGTREKDVNLAIALETKRQLEDLGATVVLTRTGDYRITLASRAAIAKALEPALFLSIHHNAAPDEQRPTPGAETYYQIASADSKRAAGLIYEEIVLAFSPYKISWAAVADAGAKYRPDASGGDYYGVLRRTAGTPAVLSEAAFISNPPEEALLVDPTFQAVEAGAFTRAIVRFVTTSDPGSGFVVPIPRSSPAGSGGGSQGCVDPPLA